MCGRYALLDLAEFVGLFPWVAPPEKFAPRYNIAPAQPILMLSNRNGGTFEHAIWGLIPAWAKQTGEVKSMINARAETLSSRPMFRGAFRHRRCIVPASGFYEWQKTSHGNQPYYVTLPKNKPMLFAGLWENTPDRGGGEIPTACVITTVANEFLQGVHDRMPAILTPEEAKEWITTPDTEAEGMTDLLGPYVGPMHKIPVGRMVNSPSHDRPDCIEPFTAEEHPRQAREGPGLFG